MLYHPSDLVLFLGRFHPLLVHLPIGGLVLLGFLELLAALTRRKDAAQSARWILGFVAGAALGSAACGWMLSLAGGYDPHLLKWHRAAGLILTGACLLTFVLRERNRLVAYRFSLAVTLLLMAVAGHLGASITHGSDFLTRYAPRSVRGLLGHSNVRHTPAQAVAQPAGPSMQKAVFVDLIQPILQQRCSNCHGPEKHKADLRLDTFEWLLKGGQDGPVISVGRAGDSSLFRCLSSPPDADGHMPPEGQAQLTAEEISRIEWWINYGIAFPTKMTEVDPKPGINNLLGSKSKQR